MRLIGIAIVFACATSVGCEKKVEATSSSTCATCVAVGEHGFVPNKLTLAKGAPGSKTDVTFTRTTDQTCALDVVFPEIHINQPLPLNKPVTVAIPTDTARTLTFQCGMAMYKSALVVQ